MMPAVVVGAVAAGVAAGAVAVAFEVVFAGAAVVVAAAGTVDQA